MNYCCGETGYHRREVASAAYHTRRYECILNIVTLFTAIVYLVITHALAGGKEAIQALFMQLEMCCALVYLVVLLTRVHRTNYVNGSFLVACITILLPLSVVLKALPATHSGSTATDWLWSGEWAIPDLLLQFVMFPLIWCDMSRVAVRRRDTYSQSWIRLLMILCANILVVLFYVVVVGGVVMATAVHPYAFHRDPNLGEMAAFARVVFMADLFVCLFVLKVQLAHSFVMIVLVRSYPRLRQCVPAWVMRIICCCAHDAVRARYRMVEAADNAFEYDLDENDSEPDQYPMDRLDNDLLNVAGDDTKDDQL